MKTNQLHEVSWKVKGEMMDNDEKDGAALWRLTRRDYG